MNLLLHGLVGRDFAVADVDDTVGMLRYVSNNGMISSPVLESRLPVGSSASTMDGEFTSCHSPKL
jgi:hypothetical protein